MGYERRILCIGAGYVGGPTMAVIADRCPHVKVTVVDVNAARIAAWNSGQLPIFEPGLQAVVERCRGRNLFFETDIDAAIDEADFIFVSVNTPTKTFGLGAGMASDLQYWERTARHILRVARGPKIVIEKSTLPVRTAEAMERILNAPGGAHRFEVLSNPEFLAEGSAVADLEEPDRVLIGHHPTAEGRAAAAELRALYGHWVPQERILLTNVWSSELTKLTANAFLAQRVSSINAISALCERTGANVDEVARAVGMDHRLGGHFLQAGLGFGGSCFKKDLLNLTYLCEHYGLAEAAHYWRAVLDVNDWQRRRFVQRIVETMFGTLSGKRIAVFGFAFKANTGDTRESPAQGIVRDLLEERAEVVVSDPQALDNARLDLGDVRERLRFEADPYAAAAGADAIVLCTAWGVYRNLDWARIHRDMTQPSFVFDGRNHLDAAALRELGFTVLCVGS